MPSFSELILIQFHLIRWVQGKRCLGVSNISGGEFFTSFGQRTFIYLHTCLKETSRKVLYWWPTWWSGESFAFCQTEFLRKWQKKHRHFADFYLTIISWVWPNSLPNKSLWITTTYPPPAVGWGKLPHYRCPKYTFPACRVWSPQFCRWSNIVGNLPWLSDTPVRHIYILTTPSQLLVCSWLSTSQST